MALPLPAHEMGSLKGIDFDKFESTNNSREMLSAIHHTDDALLRKLGYKSEFKREFSVRAQQDDYRVRQPPTRILQLLETTSFSLAILAVSCGVTTGYSYPLLAGGHFAMVWGWFIPCIFITCVAASMAELASSMPTSAGLYYFSAKMASEKQSALASWITGWSNITGQVTLICSINYSCTELITTGIAMATDGALVLGSGATFGIILALHVTQAILCSSGTRILARMTVSVLIIILGTTIGATISLLICSRGIVSSRDAFTKFENSTGWSNSRSLFAASAYACSPRADVWVFILSFTQPMWSLTGYDSAVHIAEETSNAAWAAPIAIMVGVLGTEILGWLMYIAVSFATASVPGALQSKLVLPIGDVFLNVLGRKGTFVLWWSMVVLQYLCGCSQTIDASRVVFAFSRDNALPGSRWWKRVNRFTQTPVNAVWFVILLSATCGSLSFSMTGFDSLASASVIGLYISYVTPIYFRITSGHDNHVGCFHGGDAAIPLDPDSQPTDDELRCGDYLVHFPLHVWLLDLFGPALVHWNPSPT
ncbi:amino acid permease-domain-containing protein [Lanmaoa asiatica]|nr:amino acid permease-domain-containing protein [Lanmaoa asiatica]